MYLCPVLPLYRERGEHSSGPSRMRAAISLLVTSTLITAACTPMQWVKPDATAEQLQNDSEQCHQDAWREAQLRSWAYQPLAPYFTRDALGRPFIAWPYRSYGDPF